MRQCDLVKRECTLYCYPDCSIFDLLNKKFYRETLRLDVEKQPEGLALKLKGGNNVFIYPKEDHQAATFTVLNFIVGDLEKTVDQLVSKGVFFEQFNYEGFKTDEKGIFRGDSGPRMIAWFKDPDGNFLSVLQNE